VSLEPAQKLEGLRGEVRRHSRSSCIYARMWLRRQRKDGRL
jgi:hypothetical protein